MPAIIQYLLKLSLSIAVIHAFYHLVLRRLTFYNLNRWYLLGYSLLCFVIPLINIDPVVNDADKAITIIPSVQNFTGKYVPIVPHQAGYVITRWDIILGLLVIGALIMLIRLLSQFVSLRKIKSKAVLLSDAGTAIYQVDEQITPFSFGNSIYLNKNMHTDRELEEIILHEYVHVKQRHTFDILLAEVYCIINWYNPFAWFMRHSIKQNLEFIADDNVVRSGMDKKAYQYHLLKVVGVPQYRIANQFNFSSLKKRIIMMNRARTAKIHLLRFLFILPLLAVTLVAFRQDISKAVTKIKNKAIAVKDTSKISVSNLSVKNLPVKESKDADLPAKQQDLTIDKASSAVYGNAEDSTMVDKQHHTLTLYGNAAVTNNGRELRAEKIQVNQDSAGIFNANKAVVLINGKVTPGIKNIPVSRIRNMNIIYSNKAKSLYGGKGQYGAIQLTVAPDTLVMLTNDKDKKVLYYIIDSKASAKPSDTALHAARSLAGNTYANVTDMRINGKAYSIPALDLNNSAGINAIRIDGKTYSFKPGDLVYNKGMLLASAAPMAVGVVITSDPNELSYIIDPKHVETNQFPGMTKIFNDSGFDLKFSQKIKDNKLKTLNVYVRSKNNPGAGSTSASVTYNIDKMQDGNYWIRVKANKKTGDVAVVSVPAGSN